METTPELANCPNDNSRYTRGIPVMNNMMMKGMRNAPESRNRKKNFDNIYPLSNCNHSVLARGRRWGFCLKFF